MSSQQYSLCEVYVNGKKLTEETSVKVARDSKAQIIETVAKGFAGVSPGSNMITVSIESAVPAADFEIDPGSYISNLKVVELTLYAAGRTLTSSGFFISDNFSHATNSPSGLTFEFVGSYAQWT